MVQYWYHNIRRRAVKTVMDGPVEACPIAMDDLYDSLTYRFEERKTQERTSYPHPPTAEEQRALNNAFPMEISADMISNAARSIRIETSPNPNHVIMRIVKQKEVAAVLVVIGTIMLQWGYTPAIYGHDRTVLVPKGPDGKTDD
ncbi:hypothetical protein BV898_10363 [Hypsibius exemplaris]|uniref:Uncharacterized protein n=1 Tax=Hypsibius exemplaris TaxID=2072580 RepID=A0A1W0WJX1_HYPEX|nr:hypothetical protein BV898_10363 [Hypsibius exemplaris]